VQHADDMRLQQRTNHKSWSICSGYRTCQWNEAATQRVVQVR